MTAPARFSPTRLAFDVLSLLLLPVVAAAGCDGPSTVAEPDTRPQTDTAASAGKGGTVEAVRQAIEKERIDHLMGAQQTPTTPQKTVIQETATQKTTTQKTTTQKTTAEDTTGAGDTAVGPQLSAMAVGTGVEQRALTGEAPRFAMEPGRIYCWSELHNTETPSTVSHIWRHGEREVARHTLEIGAAKRFRTWSYQRMSSGRQGRWSCEVLGADGEQLGMTEFEFGTPAAAAPATAGELRG